MSDQTPIRTFDIVVTQGYDIEEVDRPTGDYVRAEDVATLTARCEALDAAAWERDQLKAIVESPEKWMKWCDEQVLARCEALTAERGELEASLITEREHYGPLQQLNLELLTRCQHLEQAMRNLPQRTMNIRGDVEPDWTLTEKCIYRLGHRDARHKAADLLTAALASLLPSQEETPGTDETRVSFAAGYTAALDDALKGKP